MLRFLLVLAFAACTLSSALAERRVALVIAIDDYRTLRPLRNALNDGRAVATALRSLDFQVTSETDRDLRRVRRALDDFREDARGADVALVYFAGHGVEIAGENRLLPVDADASSLAALKASSLPLDEIATAVARAGSIGLILLDACRNDPFGTTASAGRGAVALAADVKADARPGLGRVGRADNMLFAFAAAPGQTAADGEGGNSPFAAALARYLGTDGLEIRSVLTLVQQEVYERTSGRQLPYIESALPSVFFAADRVDQLPERERVLLAMADVTPEMRAEVEQVASDAEMPLAPLYGALIAAEGTEMGASARLAKLREAADAFVSVRQELKTLAAVDPRVSALRAEAESEMAEGALASARAKLVEAAEIDALSRVGLHKNLVERTVSEASSRSLAGGAARAELRYDVAIADYEKALALFDSVARTALSRAQDDDRLALLERLGDLYTTVGRIAAAERSYGGLVRGLSDRLAASGADTQAKRDLALGYAKLGNAELAAGSTGKALKSYVTARDTLLELTRADARAAWLGDLAMTHDKLSETLRTAGDLGGAAEATVAALDIKQRLVQAAPEDVSLLRDLTVTYDALGDLSRDTGNLAEARQAYAASLEERRKIAAAHPGSVEASRDLAISYDKMGDLLRAENDPQAALLSYRDGHAIVRSLAERDPNDTNLLRDVAGSQAKIGNVERDLGDIAAALRSYQASLEISETLAAADPANLGWQRDLSIAIEKVADIERRRERYDVSLRGYERSLAIMQRLVAADPQNTDWLRDISITLEEIGGIKRKQRRDFDGAFKAFSQSLELRMRLAEAQPHNVLWQRDLALAYINFAYVADDPVVPLRKALDIVETLDATGRLPATDAQMIPALRKQIDRLGKGR